MKITREFLRQMLDMVKNVTANASIAEPKLHLFKTDVQPNQDSEPADFVEADFDGYAAIGFGATDWNTGVEPVSGNLVIEPPPDGVALQWECSGDTDLPQTIYGFYLTNETNDVVYGARRFDVPINLTTPGSGKIIRLDRPVSFQFNPSDVL